ncbi:multicopper oxidase type 2 (plasmid) [Gemmatirosa kalamazoonensis]|uniref:Multicopper oxidase type 2 n=1 Tax=Gemmatirosa kalamazoonensis TaxID=861299 RepID=W0RQ53_9BACT|nr:multicopper oxidase domain-containing protein [Gemmatirosa kalamazoonensis]AHG92470.1 multicopper oxidase type 2 [Gemmatirosa kalamazoonensis]
MWSSFVAAGVVALGARHPASGTPAADCAGLPRVEAPAAAPNDNRVAAGRLREGVLTVHLVARGVSWRPDGPRGCALGVRAFAEEGKTARIPGPLVRVRAGTEVRATVRNALASPLWVRGLRDRADSTLDSVLVAPGATREFRFRATALGAWYYWAGAVDARVPVSDVNGQLVGALVVDPANGPRLGDRVFVMTRWTPDGQIGTATFQLNALNGLSWPHTERLAYAVGDSVRWHVINASDELHMMHLHGFYYRVIARGDAAHDSALTSTIKPMAVTIATRRGEWMSIVWSPDRAGNWLFHCHILAHMSAAQRLGATDGHEAHDMAGLLLGITVRPPPGAHTAAATARPARVLQLYADTRPRVFGERPGFGFVLQDGARTPAPDSIRIPGMPLVLTRGEPVQITVHNRLPTPIGVHWHGIELESYYDGVGGFSGAAGRIAPMIAPGDSFIARMTPPRAGTFIYHVHSERGDELVSGLYGPLLVLEPGAPLDARVERLLVIATGGPGADAPTFVNGKATPDTLSLVAGTRYRLRVIDISANDAHALALREPGGALATWRVIGRDGRDVPAAQAVPQPARENTAAGVTRDFELTPTAPGDYALSIALIVAGRPTAHTTVVPVRVRASPSGDR